MTRRQRAAGGHGRAEMGFIVLCLAVIVLLVALVALGAVSIREFGW